MTIHRPAVVGLGTMGSGVVQLLALAGLPVTAYGRSPESVRKGRTALERALEKMVSRQRLSAEDRDAALGRIAWTTHLEDLSEADFVLEATPEVFSTKRATFAALQDVVGPDTVLATNTSSLSVTEIAATTDRPGNVVGMHFFNPAAVLKLVEIVRTTETTEAVVAATRQLAETLGKHPVVLEDRPGFIANRLLFAYLNHAGVLLERGEADVEDIDHAMRSGAGLPMGPFTLMDLIGLDVCHQIMDSLAATTDLPVRTTRHQLATLVAAGRLGRKSGAGYHSSPDAEEAAPADAPALVLAGEAAEGEIAGLAAEAGLDPVLRAGRDTAPALPAGSVLVLHESDLADEALLAEAADRCSAVVLLSPTPLSADRLPAGLQDVFVRGVLHPATRNGRLLEFGRSTLSAPGALAAARSLAEALGLRACVSLDRPGLVLDRLRDAMLADAAAMAQSGYATADDIDAAMTLGCGYPEGPIAAIDRLGAADVVERLSVSHADDPMTPAPPALLMDHAAAGRPLRPTT